MKANLSDEILGVPASKKREFRSTDLSVSFASGYAAGWFMAIPDSFRASLDIALTARVQKHSMTGEKSNVMVWTEGRPPIYTFSVGDMLYDTKAVYQKAWGKAISEIRIGIQVIAATPDKLVDKTSKSQGQVRFAVYRPRPDKSVIDVVAKRTITQDEFVAALKTGELPDGVPLLSLI